MEAEPPLRHQRTTILPHPLPKKRRNPRVEKLQREPKSFWMSVVAKLYKTQLEGDQKIDNAKLAAAAADVLAGAKHYGKMDGNSYGKYVDMAEGYLQEFG